MQNNPRVTFHRWVGGPSGHRECLGEVHLTGDTVTFDSQAWLEPWLRHGRWDPESGRRLSTADGAEWFAAVVAGRIWRPGTSSAYGAPWAEVDLVPIEAIEIGKA